MWLARLYAQSKFCQNGALLCGDRSLLEILRNIAVTLEQHEVFWKHATKSFWLSSVDCNSKYFHMQASTRKQLNSIVSLQDDNGN